MERKMRDDHILALATGQGLDKVWGEDGGWIGSAERTELKSSNSLTGEGGRGCIVDALAKLYT